MRKLLLVCLILSLILPLSLASATERESSSLSLVLPSGTFKMGFSSDTNRTELTKPVFTLNSNNLDYENVITGRLSDDQIYATATVSFYVWYEALVSTGESGATIKVKASDKLVGSSSTDTLEVVDSSKISFPSGATVLTYDSAAKEVVDNVVTIKTDKVYAGNKHYILGYNVKNAKSGVTYTGTVTLSVVANS